MKFEASFLLLLGACVAVAVGKPQNLDDEEVNSTKYTFATASQNVTAKLGDTVKIDCDVQTEDGKPVAADQQEILTVWLFKGAALFAGTTKLTRDRRMSLTGRSLVIADVREADAGEYMCQLTTWGEPRLSQHLVIQLPPTIKAVKDTIIAKDGDDVILECVAAGSPEPSITWKAKGETLSVTGRTLTLEQVSLHQAGVYTCEASNGVGGPVSSQIKLEVMYKPVIKIDKSWIHSGENNQAELTCIIGGQPAPTVTWLKDGVELDSDSEHWSQRREEGADIYVLELKNLKRDHFGTYQCRAENSLGSAEGMIELSGIAHRVEFSSPPNGKKPDSYLLKWTVESYSPVKEYTIKYRKVKANATTDAAGEWATLTVPGDAELKGAASHKHTKEFMLRNLSLATEYEVSVQVTNVFGSNTPSTFKFATLGSKVAAPTTAKGAQKEGGASLASPSWITLAVVLGAMAHASLAPVFLPARLI